MSSERFTLRSAVYLNLERENRILLVRRFNTGWMDGMYSLIAGHLDGKETVTQAMVREAKEEAGIDVRSEDLHVVHTMHRKSNERLEYIDFFLTADQWQGEPKICEPNKCDKMQWFDPTNLPDNLLPYVKNAIESYKKGITFSEMGWKISSHS